METQNITLSLREDTLLEVKLPSVRRGTSVSDLLAGQLEKLIAEGEAYDRAHQRHLTRLEQEGDLGTKGQIDVSRDELHER